MNKRLLNILTLSLAAAAILILTDTGSAQPKKEARGKRLTKPQVEKVVNRVEERVNNFVKHFDKSLDRSGLNGTEREDWLMKRARDLESATDELRREFDARDNWAENQAEVRSCLNIASDIDKNIRNRNFSQDTENIWSNVRYELNTLADIYNLPRVGSNAY